MKVEDLLAIVEAQFLKIGMRRYEDLHLTSFEKVDTKWHISARFMLWEAGIGSFKTVNMVIDDETGEVTKMGQRDWS